MRPLSDDEKRVLRIVRNGPKSAQAIADCARLTLQCARPVILRLVVLGHLELAGGPRDHRGRWKGSQPPLPCIWRAK